MKISDVGNARYLEVSIEELPFSDNSFDVIISFETIEHVNEELQNKFLKEIKRCLKDDGILVMSSPDKRTYTDLPGYHNEFHVKEFYFDEFDAFLRREFKYVEHYLQGKHDLSGEMLYPAKDGTFSLKMLNRLETDKDQDRYIVSVCSNDSVKCEESISSWFSYEYVPIAYRYTENAYKSENAMVPTYFDHSNTYKVIFDLSNVYTDGRLRFDSLEDACCEFEMISIKTDVKDYNIIPFNAIRQFGNKYVFITIDPIIEIIGDFSQSSYLEIEYIIKFLNVKEVSLIAYEKFCVDNDMYENMKKELVMKITTLENELKVIKSTKSYKYMEKMRKLGRKLL